MAFQLFTLLCLLGLQKCAFSQTEISACTFEDGVCNYAVNVWDVAEWSDEGIVPQPNEPGDHYLEIRPGDQGADSVSEAEVRIPFTLSGTGSVDLDVYVQSRPSGPGAFYLLQGENTILYMWESDTTEWTTYNIDLDATGDDYLMIYIPSAEASKLEIIAIDNIVIIESDSSASTVTSATTTESGTTTEGETTTSEAYTTTTEFATTSTEGLTTTTEFATPSTEGLTTTPEFATTTSEAYTTTTEFATPSTEGLTTTPEFATPSTEGLTTTPEFATTSTEVLTTTTVSSTTSGLVTLSCDFEDDFCSWIDVFGGFERVAYGSILPFPPPASGMWFLVNYVTDVEAEIELNLPCSSGTVNFKYFLLAAGDQVTTNSNLLVFHNVDRSTIPLSGGEVTDGWNEITLVLEETDDTQIGFSSLVLNDGEVAGIDDVIVTLSCDGQPLQYRFP
jgi:hypothetical protein